MANPGFLTARASTALPAPRSPRYLSLDHWRGFACFLVLVNHSVFYNGSGGSTALIRTANEVIAAIAARLWIGVPIFFVISGYCISATVDSHRRKEFSARRYFYKRFRRIFPPYWAVLGCTAVVLGAVDLLLRGAVSAYGEWLRPWWFSGWQWAGTLTLTEIWRPHVIGTAKGLFLGPAWTLCYEEQFYAVTGALLLLCPRRFFLGALAVTGAVGVIALGATTAGAPIDGFFFDGAWLQFAMGILLYYAINYGERTTRFVAAAAFAAVVAAASVADGAGLLAAVKNAPQAYFVAGAFALVALVLHGSDRAIARARLFRPLEFCGVMCYSLYLVQAPVIALERGLLRASSVDVHALTPLVTLPLGIIGSIAVARFCFLTVESRFMRSPEPVAALRPALEVALS